MLAGELTWDVVVVGGGPAGVAAALAARAANVTSVLLLDLADGAGGDFERPFEREASALFRSGPLAVRP